MNTNNFGHQKQLYTKERRFSALKELNKILKKLDEVFPNSVNLNGLTKTEIDKFRELSKQINAWKFETDGRILKLEKEYELEEEVKEEMEAKEVERKRIRDLFLNASKNCEEEKDYCGGVFKHVWGRSLFSRLETCKRCGKQRLENENNT
jgi:hypothetical protein